jgi:hypothetical protein
MYNEQCIRDHAETYAPQGGAVVFGHSHRAGMARGRRSDNPLGFNTGCGIDIEKAGYAHHRRSTLSWTHGFVWGSHNGKRSQLYLLDNGQNREWLLPPV